VSIFYNIHGQFVKDEPRLLNIVQAQRPRWALVMDNAGMATRIADRSSVTNVIHRTYRDDGFWTGRNPDEWLAFHRAAYGDTRLWHYTDNEVGIQAEWHIEAIKKNAAAARPLRMVICNTSTGSPGWDEWQTPKAQELLDLVAQYRDWCVLGVHEYFMGVPTTGLQGFIAETDVSKWPAVRNNAIPDYHVGRWRRIQKSGVRVVVTEYGSDSLADLHARWMKIEGGWKPAAEHWERWYPTLTVEQAYYMALWYGWHIAYANSQVEGALIFSYGSNPQSAGTAKDWTRYDVEPLGALHNLIAANAVPVGLERMQAPTQPPPVEPPKPEPPKEEPPPFRERVVTVDFSAYPGGVRFRESAVDGNVIALLRGKVQALLMSDDEENPDWYKAQIDNRIGWFKQLPGVTFADYVPPAEPTRYEIVIPLPGVTEELAIALAKSFGNATVHKVA
jgi:hypothetical protein